MDGIEKSRSNGKEGESAIAKLFPKLPRDYFKDKGNPFKAADGCGRRSVIRPFVKIIDLNEGEGKKKPAVVVGVKGSF